MQNGDAVLPDGFDNGQWTSFASWHQEAKFCPLERPPEKLPHRNVEVIGGLLQDDIVSLDRIGVLHPVQAIHHGAMLNHDSLRFAGRAGGIHQVGEISRLIDDDRIFLRPQINSGIIHIDDRSIEGCSAGRLGVHDQYSDLCILQHVVGAGRRIIGR